MAKHEQEAVDLLWYVLHYTAELHNTDWLAYGTLFAAKRAYLKTSDDVSASLRPCAPPAEPRNEEPEKVKPAPVPAKSNAERILESFRDAAVACPCGEPATHIDPRLDGDAPLEYCAECYERKEDYLKRGFAEEHHVLDAGPAFDRLAKKRAALTLDLDRPSVRRDRMGRVVTWAGKHPRSWPSNEGED